MANNMPNMQDKWRSSYLFGGNADFIEELYDSYLDDPKSVELKWQSYFNSLQDAKIKDVSQGAIKQKFSIITSKPSLMSSGGEISDAQTKVWRFIEAYRATGMEYAQLDPLKLHNRPKPDELLVETYGIQNELDNEFYVDLDISSSKKFKLKDIVNRFDSIYCENSGFEFGHIADLNERSWLTQYVENNYLNFRVSAAEKVNLLQKLTEADGWERFLHTKYPSQKRFSLEGGDALIPALDRVIKTGAKNGISEVYIGMAHRGRLNTLVNILGKSPQKIFDEFASNYPHYDFVTSGDVKYHKGYQCNYVTESGLVKTVLAYNPSHLEVVNPVVNGMVRSKQDTLSNIDGVLGVLVHGDSALIGLGTNQGVLNMSQTRGYGVGGIIHIVVNNQVGFTTSDIRDNRSSRYCSDIAKMIESPIFHVNGDNVESIAFIMDLAIEYRQKYKKDIFINIVCFRRHGHNEADDPSLTQPYMYRLIKQHPGARKLYANKLVGEGVVTDAIVDTMSENYRLALVKGTHVNSDTMKALKWYDNFDTKVVLEATENDKVKTSIDLKTINKVTFAVTTLPENFTPHPTVTRLIDSRRLMGNAEHPVDFGMAEMLVYGSLLLEGISVRMSGEDTCRGTFTHRHAVWHDLNRSDISDSGYSPLAQLQNNSKLKMYDSVLNEECVLGFEYGYSTQSLRDLVIWEAQFGDFANGAQVIIDQFIISGEAKWGTLSNLTLMLPHGYDGQGPEHSSARVERFLQLCAENNIRVVMPSTAAQMFHILRNQALTNYIKPLVIFMSKRLLRYKDAMSSINDFVNGGFNRVLPETTTKVDKVERVIVCAGQVYYDFYNERSRLKLDNEVAIIRLEQFYPFPTDLLKQELAKFNKATKFIWGQEEPYNQGSWLMIRDSLDFAIDGVGKFSVVSRPAAAAPACGYGNIHTKEIAELLAAAFA